MTTNGITTILSKAIEKSTFPGCVIGIIDNEKGERYVLPMGTHTYDPGSPSMTKNSIFDVASITKTIPTSSLALYAIDKKLISLDEKIVQWIPELQSRFKNDITIFHLLTHTLDFSFSLSSLKHLPAEKILETIFQSELRSPPGHTFFYCNATSILLGILIERIFNQKLSILAQDYFFKPLKMSNTCFSIKKMAHSSIVPTEIDPWRNRVICGEIHDESAWVLRDHLTPGSAGLFSSVPDLLLFADMILHKGMYQSQRYFSKEIIQAIGTNQIPHTGMCTGLGWELNQDRYMGNTCSNYSIGKTGFTGCLILCDLKKYRALVLLSNYTWPKRKPNAQKINTVRKTIADIVFT